MSLSVASDRLSARQLGLVTRRQCLDLGMTDRQLGLRLASGLLVAAYPGVYRVAAVPRSIEQDLLAACMAAGRGAVASHRSAAATLGLRGVNRGRPEVTVPVGRRPYLPDVIVHRSPLDAADLGRRGPIPLTRPARTLLDLAGVEPELVEGALDDALVRGLTTLGSLQRMLSRVGGRGRVGGALLRHLIAERSGGQAPTESPLEDHLVRLFRRHGLPAPVRQHEVTRPDGSVVRIDLAYPDRKLGIEADGRAWHSGRADFLRDRRRGNCLAALGWTVVRYSWADLDRSAEVADEMAGLLRNRTAGSA